MNTLLILRNLDYGLMINAKMVLTAIYVTTNAQSFMCNMKTSVMNFRIFSWITLIGTILAVLTGYGPYYDLGWLLKTIATGLFASTSLSAIGNLLAHISLIENNTRSTAITLNELKKK